MCIEMAGRVIRRDNDVAVVETDKRHVRASTLLVPDVAVGDWVYVAAGTIIERLDPALAEQTNQMLRNAQRTLT